MSDSGGSMEADRIREIKARLAVATPGPWASAWDKERSEMYDPIVYSEAQGISEKDAFVVGVVYYDGDLVGCNQENAALIAHAPDDIRYLLDRVAMLERVIAIGGQYMPVPSLRSDDTEEIWGLRRADLADAIWQGDIGEATGVRYIAFRGGPKVANARIVAAVSRLIGPLLYRASSYGSEWTPDDGGE
jgi:hypothetical protein